MIGNLFNEGKFTGITLEQKLTLNHFLFCFFGALDAGALVIYQSEHLDVVSIQVLSTLGAIAGFSALVLDKLPIKVVYSSIYVWGIMAIVTPLALVYYELHTYALYATFIGFILLMQIDMQYGQHTNEIIKGKININRVGNAKRVWGSVAAVLSLGVVGLADMAQIEPYKMVLASHCLIVLAFMMDTFMFREYKDQVINKE